MDCTRCTENRKAPLSSGDASLVFWLPFLILLRNSCIPVNGWCQSRANWHPSFRKQQLHHDVWLHPSKSQHSRAPAAHYSRSIINAACRERVSLQHVIASAAEDSGGTLDFALPMWPNLLKTWAYFFAHSCRRACRLWLWPPTVMGRADMIVI